MLEACPCFCYYALGMQVQQANGRYSLHYGSQKINLHAVPSEFSPYAACPTPGSADLCFEAEGPMAAIGRWARRASVYLRDPDGNLVELCCYA